uniref:Uncharacterized protein n=1 Tax=Arundo donax TaxID=35708 RepID=A0A0A9FY23_ARUDO
MCYLTDRMASEHCFGGSYISTTLQVKFITGALRTLPSC